MKRVSVGSQGSGPGIAVYKFALNFALKDVPLRRMFLGTSLLGTGLGLTQLLLITGAQRTACRTRLRLMVPGRAALHR